MRILAYLVHSQNKKEQMVSVKRRLPIVFTSMQMRMWQTTIVPLYKVQGLQSSFYSAPFNTKLQSYLIWFTNKLRFVLNLPWHN